jgi:predicted dehydrogenase
MMGPTLPLGVAVVGLGVGEQHVRAFAQLPSCHVRMLCDLDLDRANNLASAYPGADVTSRFDDILARDDIAIISIASFDEAHFAQVMAALRAGKHVFVEKPLCRTPDELQAIRTLLEASRGRLHLTANLVLRSAPIYVWLKQQIAAGDFGEIYAFDGDYLYGRLHKITQGWRKDETDYSVMLGGGIHMIDLLVWLTGQRPSTVTCMANAVATRGTTFRYDDFAAATMAFDSGLIARITANFGCVHKHQHVMRIFGTKKTFLLDDTGPRIIATRDPAAQATPVHLATLPASKGGLIPAFVAGIVSGAPATLPERRAIFDGISIATACDIAIKTRALERVIYT